MQPDAVGVVAAQLPAKMLIVLTAPAALRGLAELVDERERGFLVRHGHVQALAAGRAETAHRRLEVRWLRVDQLVGEMSARSDARTVCGSAASDCARPDDRRGRNGRAATHCWSFSPLSGAADSARISVPLPTGRIAEVKQIMPDATVRRCPWSEGVDPAYERYHDTEWGVPVHDDRTHFEFLVLESAQAGLSWWTILRKRDGYRRAFADFDADEGRALRRAATVAADAATPASCATGRRSRRPSATRARSSQIQRGVRQLRRLRVAVRRRRADRQPLAQARRCAGDDARSPMR